MKKLLNTYTSYNHWANKEFAKTLSKLDQAMLDTEMKSSFPTLRKTVYHIWDAEFIWLERLLGNSINFWPSQKLESGSSIDAFVLTSENLERFVHNQPELFFEASCHYTNLKGEKFTQPNYEIINHICNHSAFHRGQLVTLLRELNIERIPATDLITFQRTERKN